MRYNKPLPEEAVAVILLREIREVFGEAGLLEYLSLPVIMRPLWIDEKWKEAKEAANERRGQ